MISFRYYLITIVAIFLALGLGVLAGSTVLDEGLVNRLQAQTDRLQGDLEDLRGQVNDLRFRMDKLNEFSEAALPVLARGRLLGRDVVVITDQGGIDGGGFEDAIGALRAADANLVTALRIDPAIASATGPSADALASMLGLPPGTPSKTLAARAATALARRLASGQQRPGDDLLAELQDAGFVADLTGASPAVVGGGDQAIVVVHGGTREHRPAPEAFLVPLVDELIAREQLDVAAAEALASQPQFVEELRGSNALAGEQFVTVDDVDQGIGQIALGLGLQRLLDLDEGGHYGFKVNATELVPPLDPAA
jgi:hypothetical protein